MLRCTEECTTSTVVMRHLQATVNARARLHQRDGAAQRLFIDSWYDPNGGHDGRAACWRQASDPPHSFMGLQRHYGAG
jgi:hypothetical protein